ncbi:unnamed protein product [Amoebophrya sp. A25]|nr:unnamed protein product [Amoebophrya sp. A25]|eukprot:GSA25T00011124001.1
MREEDAKHTIGTGLYDRSHNTLKDLIPALAEVAAATNSSLVSLEYTGTAEAANAGAATVREEREQAGSLLPMVYDCLLDSRFIVAEGGGGTSRRQTKKTVNKNSETHELELLAATPKLRVACTQKQVGQTIAWAVQGEDARHFLPTTQLNDMRFLNRSADGMQHRLVGASSFLCKHEEHVSVAFSESSETGTFLSKREQQEVRLGFVNAQRLRKMIIIFQTCGVVNIPDAFDPDFIKSVHAAQKEHFAKMTQAERGKFSQMQQFRGEWAELKNGKKTSSSLAGDSSKSDASSASDGDADGAPTELGSYESAAFAPRSAGRYEVRLPFEKPFVCPALVANKMVLALLTAVLKGPKIEIDEFSYVQSEQKTPSMHWHLDVDPPFSTQVFASGEYAGKQLPASAVVMVLPLRDLTLDDGPTEFLTGSHVNIKSRQFWLQQQAKFNYYVFGEGKDLDDEDIDKDDNDFSDEDEGEPPKSNIRMATDADGVRADKTKMGSHAPPGKEHLEYSFLPPRLAFESKRGAATFFDLRLMHRALPNSSGMSRAVLYISYVREWFKDAANFKDFHSRLLDDLPDSAMRKLLLRVETRTHTQAMQQWIGAQQQAALKNTGEGGVEEDGQVQDKRTSSSSSKEQDIDAYIEAEVSRRVEMETQKMRLSLLQTLGVDVEKSTIKNAADPVKRKSSCTGKKGKLCTTASGATIGADKKSGVVVPASRSGDLEFLPENVTVSKGLYVQGQLGIWEENHFTSG